MDCFPEGSWVVQSGEGQEVTSLLFAVLWGGKAKGGAPVNRWEDGNSKELHQGMVKLGTGKHFFSNVVKHW